MRLPAASKSLCLCVALAAPTVGAAPVGFSDGALPRVVATARASECASLRPGARCVQFEPKAPARMIESLKGATHRVKLPANARYDATGGVFI